MIINNILIQIIVIAFISPLVKKLKIWLDETNENGEHRLPAKEQLLLSKASRLLYLASTLGIILIVLMVIKPVL